MNEHRLIAFDIQGRPIVYRQHTAKTVSVSGTIENTFTDSTITKALIGPNETDSVGGSADRYIDGDIRVRVKVADLPENPPSYTSRIIADGREYAITSVEQSRSMLIVDLICRELA